MPGRPANTTQADISRTIRAAIKAGASYVEVRPDGHLLIHLGNPPPASWAGHDNDNHRRPGHSAWPEGLIP